MWLFRKKKSTVRECFGTEDELAPAAAQVPAAAHAAAGRRAPEEEPAQAKEVPVCPRDTLATAAPPPPEATPPPASPIRRLTTKADRASTRDMPSPKAPMGSASPSPKAPTGSSTPSPKAPAWPLAGSDLATTPSEAVPRSPSISAMTPKSSSSKALPEDDEEIVEITEATSSARLAPLPVVNRREAVCELSFDVPMEQIYAGLSQAFGQTVASHLRSQKWDKRAQALKEVGSVLKGKDQWQNPGSTCVIGKSLSPHERAKCWRLSCQLLNHAMQDKVMPVRIAALDLFVDTFGLEDCVPRAEVNLALGVLLEHVNVTLGDSNLRLHEAARKCVLFCAERGVPGLVGVLKTLRDRLEAVAKSRDKTKVYFGVLDTVIILLQHFPGHRASDPNAGLLDEEQGDIFDREESWTEADITPFVVAGLDDSNGTRVRDRAVALAVTVFQTLGAEAMQPMLDGLRPAKQQLLKQKFQEAEEGGLDLLDGGDRAASALMGSGQLDGLIVRGAGVKPTLEVEHGSRDLIPGSVNTDYDEEYIMDNILEEAGMVFSSTGMFNEQYAAQAAYFGTANNPYHQGRELGQLNALEEELLGMGLDMDMLDMNMLEEQQALLSSLQDSQQDRQRAYVEGDLSISDLDADLLIHAF
mmetsp:Transcript_62297/g.163578  ORF Transcript_62297/g.163578 Transcript_62297/m.163578 type:complete len:641 (-) Transcript_62297:208-2130(-)